MKKPLGFVLGVSGNLAFAAGNVALGLSRHMKRRDYEVVVLTKSLRPADRKALQQIENVTVRDFDFPGHFIERLLERLPNESRFRDPNRQMCFSHFEAFRLLDEYQNVVWLDADISVQDAIDEIVNFSPFGITADSPWNVGDNFSAPLEGYELGIPGVCAAVISLNDSLPYRDICDWCYEKAEELAPYLKNGDQGIINLAIQEFSLDVKLLPLIEWQCISWRDEAMDARIVHFGTNNKVWNRTNIRSAFPEWYRMHKAWRALGGGDFPAEGSVTRNALPLLNRYDDLLHQHKDLLNRYNELLKGCKDAE